MVIRAIRDPKSWNEIIYYFILTAEFPVHAQNSPGAGQAQRIYTIIIVAHQEIEPQVDGKINYPD